MKVKNIKSIELWTEKTGKPNNGKPKPVIIKFKYNCTYTLLEIDDLKRIIELWRIVEDEHESR